MDNDDESRAWEQLLSVMRSYLQDSGVAGIQCDVHEVTDAFISLSQHHRVSGLAASVLGTGTSVPFERAVKGSQLRALKLAAQLSELAATFEEAAVRMIALKGVALSLQRYPALGLRYVGDIDVWVSDDSVEAVHGLMQKLGYVDDGYDALSPYYRAHYRRLRHHVNYVHPRKKLTVEIHWSLMSQESSCPLDFDEAFDRGRNVKLGGRSIRTLGLFDEWIYLYTHAARHHWERLQWLMDLAVIQNHQSKEDVEGVLRLADERGVSCAVISGMALTTEILGGDSVVPAHSSKISAEDLQYLLKIGKTALGNCSRNHQPSVSQSERQRAQRILGQEGNSGRLYLEMIFLNPDDWSRVKLPDGCIWLYIPVRIWFWMMRRFSRGG